MKDKEKTKEQLIKELTKLRKRVSEMEEEDSLLRKNGERHDLALKASQDGLWDWNIKTGVEYWSPQYKKLLGYQENEIEPNFEKWESMIHPDDRQVVKDSMRNYLEKPRSDTLKGEFRIKTKSGDYRWYSSRGQGAWDKSGKAIRMVGSMRDVTEIKRMEEEIKNSYETLEEKITQRTAEVKAVNVKLNDTKEFLENVLKTSVDGVIIGDAEGKIAAVNKAVEKMFGCSSDELVGKHTIEMGFDEKQYKVSGKELINKLMADGSITGVERTWEKFDGGSIDVEINIALLKDEEGNVTGSVATIRDITARKKAEDRLRDRDLRVRALLNAPFEAILLIDKYGITLDFNKAFMDRFNVSADELRGSCCWDLLPPELAKSRQMIVDRVFQSGEPIRSEDQREEMFLENAIYPICDQSGEVTCVAIFSRDITEYKQALYELKLSKYYTDNIIESSLDVIVVTDMKGCFTRVNNAFLQLTGFSETEVIGKHMSEFSPTIEGTYECSTGELIEINEEFYQNVESNMSLFIEKGIMHNAIGYLLCKENKIVPVEDSMVYLTDTEGMRIGAVAIARDITERKKAERKLLDYQGQLKGLTADIILTEERERRHFADFLHDEIGQQLLATQLQLQQLKSSLSTAENTKRLDNAIHYIKRVIDRSRSLTFELSSPILHELGLEKALEWLAENTHKKYGITVTFEDDKQEKPLDDNGKIFYIRPSVSCS